MRLTLVRLGKYRWQMVWTLHHILLDGWSSAALLAEVLTETQGGHPTRPAPYRDYFQWLANRDAAASERFWRDQLKDLSEPTRLAPLLAGPDTVPTQNAGLATVTLAPDPAPLQTFARQRQVTLNTLVQAAWTLILQRYTGSRQVTFGATVSGRPAAVTGMEHQLGLFINTLPVRQAPAPEQRLGDWLQQLAGPQPGAARA